MICFFQGILDSQLVHHTPQIKYEFTQTKNRESIGSSSTSPEGRFYRVNGKNFSARSAKDVVIGILIEMQKIDPSFFEKCYNHDANRGRNRTFIGKSPKELYTNRPDLEDCNYRLAKGWYLMTNFNNQVKRSIISMALDVMGYKLGREVDYKLEK